MVWLMMLVLMLPVFVQPIHVFVGCSQHIDRTCQLSSSKSALTHFDLPIEESADHCFICSFELATGKLPLEVNLAINPQYFPGFDFLSNDFNVTGIIHHVSIPRAPPIYFLFS